MYYQSYYTTKGQNGAMIFRKATQEDLDYVRQNPFEGAVKDYHYMEIPDDNCITGIFDGCVVGVGGVRIKWDGVGLLWLMLTKDCEKKGLHGIIALSAIREKMNELIERNNLWRVQATVRTDFPQAIKMIEFFGFKREGLMKMYNPDKTDSYLYAKVF